MKIVLSMSLIFLWQTISLSTILTYDVFTNDSSLVRKCLDIINFLLTVVPKTGLLLFCFMANFASLQLTAIRSAIKLKRNPFLTKITSSSAIILPESLIFDLKLLKKQYLLVSYYMNGVNQKFSLYLMIETTFIFIGVINSSMFVVTSAMSSDSLLGIVNCFVLLDQLIRMYLITSYSETIRSEVMLFANQTHSFIEL